MKNDIILLNNLFHKKNQKYIKRYKEKIYMFLFQKFLHFHHRIAQSIENRLIIGKTNNILLLVKLFLLLLI